MVQHSSIDHTGLTGVSTVSYASNANAIAGVPAGGAASTLSRGDHVHDGVTSISHTSNTFDGPVTFTASGSLGITSPSAGTLNFSAVDTGGGGGASDLSGEELDYVAKTSNTTITATSSGTANTIVTANAVAYDGATTIMLEFFTAFIDSGVGLLIAFFDGSTQVDVFGAPQDSVRNQGGIIGSLRITPSNASHTYSVRAWVTSGSGTVYGGTGTGGNIPPAYIRQTRV